MGPSGAPQYCGNSPGPFELHMFHHLRWSSIPAAGLLDRNNAKDNDDADADENEREDREEGDDEPTNLPWCLRYSVQRKAVAS
jgi:hypothetical protein